MGLSLSPNSPLGCPTLRASIHFGFGEVGTKQDRGTKSEEEEEEEGDGENATSDAPSAKSKPKLTLAMATPLGTSNKEDFEIRADLGTATLPPDLPVHEGRGIRTGCNRVTYFHPVSDHCACGHALKKSPSMATTSTREADAHVKGICPLLSLSAVSFNNPAR